MHKPIYSLLHGYYTMIGVHIRLLPHPAIDSMQYFLPVPWLWMISNISYITMSFVKMSPHLESWNQHGGLSAPETFCWIKHSTGTWVVAWNHIRLWNSSCMFLILSASKCHRCLGLFKMNVCVICATRCDVSKSNIIRIELITDCNQIFTEHEKPCSAVRIYAY